jgi:hypothetical protein
LADLRRMYDIGLNDVNERPRQDSNLRPSD